MLSLWMMGAGSLMIALTPDYGQIGMIAPLLLIMARLLQGLSVGGEYGASATYLSEIAGEKHREFFSSFQYVTLIMGQLLALGLLILLQTYWGEAALTEGGWRIAFWVGAGLALVALWLRGQMDETLPESSNTPLLKTVSELWRTHPKECLQVAGLTLGGTVAFYTFTTYLQKYLVNSAGWSKPEATLLSAATLAVFMLMQPVIGALSDRVGRKPILMAFGVMGVLFTYPLMTALGKASQFASGFILSLLALMIVACYTSINAVVKAELFSQKVRALGVAFPYALTVAIFGGTAEYIALWFKHIGHESYYFIYVTVAIGFSLITYWRMSDTKRISKI